MLKEIMNVLVKVLAAVGTILTRKRKKLKRGLYEVF